jgi:hypothetical protein
MITEMRRYSPRIGCRDLLLGLIPFPRLLSSIYYLPPPASDRGRSGVINVPHRQTDNAGAEFLNGVRPSSPPE